MATRSDVKMVTGKINGQDVTVPAGTTILEAAREAGIEVPNLCYQPLLRPWGSCRICTVEILGKRGGLIESCATPLGEGMEVLTHSEPVHRRPPVHPADVSDRSRARLPDLRQIGRVLSAGQHLPPQHQRQSVPSPQSSRSHMSTSATSSTTSGTAASCATAARASAMR